MEESRDIPIFLTVKRMISLCPPPPFQPDDLDKGNLYP